MQAAYTVYINDDNSITTSIIEEGVSRKANTFDIYQTSKELVSDIESQLLADRIARTVVAQLQPKDAAEEIKSKIINALSDRGIDTPLN
jgi:hypothetical protein